MDRVARYIRRYLGTIASITVKSIADIVADVAEPLPFENESVDCVIARHILEHCLDSVKTLRQWTKVLKKGGRIIISCPDENVCEGIQTYAWHVHGFTPDSMDSLVETVGLHKIGGAVQPKTGQFTNCYEKPF